MKLHRHKWEYLSKEIAVEKTKTSYDGFVTLGSTVTTEREVTHIKRFCKRCGDIDVQTVPGKLLAKDLQTMGYYDIQA